jgi:hypothetical protein
MSVIYKRPDWWKTRNGSARVFAALGPVTGAGWVNIAGWVRDHRSLVASDDGCRAPGNQVSPLEAALDAVRRMSPGPFRPNDGGAE